MPVKTVTIQDVAREAMVSIATVSRVLNDKGPVSPEKRKQVIAAVEKLDYNIDQTSRIDRKVSANLLLIIVPRISNPFYSEIIHGFQNNAYRHGYEVLLCQSMNNPHRTGEYINLLKNKVVIGAVTLNPSTYLDVFSKVGRSYPIVQCCEYNSTLDYSYVSIDNTLAARRAVQFLLSVGYSRIALVNSSLTFKYAQDRQAGYEQVLTECGLPVRPEWIVHISDVNYSLALSAAEQLLALPEPPDAIFAVSDVIAAAVVKVAKKMGVRVPQDLGVIGFDNTEISLMCEPSISTINQPRYEIGTYACDLLLEQIGNPRAPARHLLLNTELIARESTMR
jgi:LacI family repressor for deo operon, udp, cdd, tsx, nupC, and nupG